MEEEGSKQSTHRLVHQEVQGQELYYEPMSPTQQGLGVIGQFRPSRSFSRGVYTNRSPRLQQSPSVGDFALQPLWTGAAHIHALASSGWDSKLWGKCGEKEREREPGVHVREAIGFSRVF